MDGSAILRGVPSPLTQLIGRQHELAALKDLVCRNSVRLITLTGPGGVGKTCLAVHAAYEVATFFADGVAFVSVATISDSTLVISAIGQSLGLREGGERVLAEQITSHLGSRQLLLVLDNFEQVAEAAAQLTDLLCACPGLKILVTSRMTLHVSGEHEFAVPPLTLPDQNQLDDPKILGDVDAVSLFIARARAVRTDFQLTASNAKYVAEICRRVDGLPLALELAASLVKVLPLHGLLSRLDQRLHVLVGGPHDLPSRQQSLRNVLAWSYNLLNPNEQRLFRRLAVFSEGCTWEAIETVCFSDSSTIGTTSPSSTPSSPHFNTLYSLTDKSLVQQIASDEAEPRYTVLETIREYALEQLVKCDEAELIHQTHAKYYLAFAEDGERGLKSAEQENWLTWLELEHANLRAARRWAQASNNIDLVLRLCGALWHFWSMHGYLSEGRRWIREALAARSECEEPMAKSSLAKTLCGGGWLAYFQSDFGQAASLLGESLTLHRQLADQQGMAMVLNGMAAVARLSGDRDTARTLYTESLAISKLLDDRWGIAQAKQYLGITLWFEGDSHAAEPMAEDGLAIFRELGCRWDIANALFNCACIKWSLEDYGPSQALGEESLTLMRRLGDRRGVARALFHLGDIALLRGDFVRAAPFYRDCLTIFNELGNRWFVAQSLMYTAWLSIEGYKNRAARLLGAMQALRKSIRSPVPEFDRPAYERRLEMIQEQLDGEIFRAEWAIGQNMPLAEAVQYAYETLDLILEPPEGSTDAKTHRATSPSHAHQIQLSPREQQVLRLVATGLTDAQVAEQLIISPRTVNTHLNSIYNKLGVSSRMAAVHYACGHDII